MIRGDRRLYAMTSRNEETESADGTGKGVACGIEGKVSATQSRNPVPGALSTEQDRKRHGSPKNDNQKQAHANNRTCLAEAICALLPDRKKALVFLDICLAMPMTGDTLIRCANNVLTKHGMVLRRVNTSYNQRGGTPFHLLKERNHNLVINIKLGDLLHGTGFTSHFIAWDGKTLWDHLDSVQVNFTSNQATVKGCNLIFKGLYQKNTHPGK